jgi:hypothetical protein
MDDHSDPQRLLPLQGTVEIATMTPFDVANQEATSSLLMVTRRAVTRNQ